MALNPLTKSYESNHPNGIVKPKVKTPTGSGLGNTPTVKATNPYTPGAVNPLQARYDAKQAQPINPALPWDGIAEGQAATAGASYKNSIDQTAANRAIGLQEFGVDAGYDDYKNNPYSQAAILQHNHESNARGINTTAGQALYSGQTGNAQGIEQGRTNQAHQGLVNEDERAKAGWIAEEKAAEIAEREANNAAQEGAVERASAAPGPEVALPEGNGGGGGSQQKEKIPYPAPPNKKWAWNGSHWHLVKG